MSEPQPPVGTPEYLEHGSIGSDTAEGAAPARRPRRSRRTTWLVGGGIVGVLALGAGAWAAMSFFRQGAQPAEALPASTIGYVSVDLDPSGSQKIDAFRTLNKFPAFQSRLGVHSVDDVRRKLGEGILRSAHCTGLTYDHDLAPWLGDRAAVAATRLGGGAPTPVVVVQVTDEAKARTGLNALRHCDTGGPAQGGYLVHDGWAVIAKTQQVAQRVVDATARGSLADDATYRKWTQALGTPGVVTMYAAPAAGDYLAGQLGRLGEGLLGFGAPGGVSGYSVSTQGTVTGSADTGGAATASGSSGLVEALRGFRGAAATIRFTGDGLELATVMDRGTASTDASGDQAGVLVSALPDDTMAALGVSLRPGWMSTMTDRLGRAGGGLSRGRLYAEIHRQTGLDAPEDVETLLGSAAALSVGPGLDVSTMVNGSDPHGVPVALTVQGDPTAIERVLDKIRTRFPEAASLLGSDSAGDTVVIGPTPGYRKQVLDGGHLGDTGAYRSVVSDSEHAGSVLFVDIDRLEPAIDQAAAGDHRIVDNVAPLQAFGISGWLDGDVAHGDLRISTD